MKKRHVIRTLTELRAMRSPLRHEIVTAMERLGACTVAELATDLGRKAESLYYHVLALGKAGLVREREKRPAVKRPEAVYELVAREIVVDPLLRSRGFLGGLGEVYGAALRAADREVKLALEHETGRTGRRPRAAGVARWTVRLTPDGAAKLREVLTELGAVLAEHHDPEGDPYTVTVALARRPE